ncbi:MAG: FlgD immunoglobulin-like domain containing protein [Stygiobacter sp.]|jgi:hypothetical protein
MKKKLTIFAILILIIGFNINFAQPTNDSPINSSNVILVGGSVQLNWSGGTGPFSITYTINGGAPTIMGGVTSPYTLSGLNSGDSVNWFITDSGSNSSTPTSFIVVNSPTPNPSNGATNQDVNTTTQVFWTGFDEGGFGNGPYDVEVYTGGFGGTLVTSSTGQVGLSLSLTTPLLYNTTYSWRVRDTDIDGSGGDGTWQQFTFTTQAVPAPSLTSPANTLTGVSIQPTFSWTWSGSGSVNYQIQVSTSNAFGTTVFDSTFTTVTNVSLVEARKLLNNTTYYWRVRAIQGSNNSAWSTTYSFKTIPVVTILPISPINASTNVEFNPTYFSFQSLNGNGTLTYVIQYLQNTTVPTSAQWAGANTITITNLLSQLPYPEILKANKKYYWRVVVKNSSSEIISYSGNYYFTTKSGAYTPYLSYPTGGMSVYTNSPSFYWYIGTSDLTNLNFTLIVATNNTFTTGVDSVVNINALQYDWTGTPFTPGTTYYWKVLCWYKKGVAGEQQVLSSSYSSFIPQGSGFATTPYLAYPTGGITIYTTTPILYWYTGASTAGVFFDVYIKLSTSGGYTQIADNTTNLYLDLAGTLLNPFTLSAGSTYNWYVVAQGSNGDITSSTGSFVVSSSIGTGSPIASWPVGNPYVYSLTPTLYWYMYGSTTGLTKFVIKYKQTNTAPLDWDTEGGTTDVNISDLNSTSYDIPSNLTAGSKYYWAIAGYNGTSRVTSWSSGSFTISSSTTAVNVYLSAPIGGVTVFTLTPTLYWYATGAISGISSYDLTYSNTSGFVSGPSPAYTTTVTGLTDNFYTLPSNSANAGATIYWKVTVHYTGGGSSTSTTGSFVIDPGSSSVVPLVGSPINNVQLKTTAATLSWAIPAQTKASLTYTLEYADNNNFANSKVINDLKQNYYTVSGLKDNSTYYWRVKSNAGNTSSNYSSVAQFTTIAKVTDVENEKIPTEFTLEQNYPNPFNPSTLIKYSLPKNAYVTIKIYDMLGNEIKTLVSNESAAGNYSVQWNGDDNFGNKVSTGAYIYRITAGDFTAVRKMLLIK